MAAFWVAHVIHRSHFGDRVTVFVQHCMTTGAELILYSRPCPAEQNDSKLNIIA